MKKDISVILLAGGIGSRMGAPLPKQFLSLKGKPLARYSFDLFTSLEEIGEIAVVCAPEFRHLFTLPQNCTLTLTFALPGERRQDSVLNGLKSLQSSSTYVLVHDGARPFIDKPLVQRALSGARLHGASAAAVPVKMTIKQANLEAMVTATPDRSALFEMQTPQVLKRTLLEEGFMHAQKHALTVTDDVSLVEPLGHPVFLSEGSYKNLKITTQEDWSLAELIAKA